MDIYELMMNTGKVEFRLSLNSGKPYLSSECFIAGCNIGSILEIPIKSKEDFNTAFNVAMENMVAALNERVKSIQNGEEENMVYMASEGK